jgi:ferritin-like metal-binding protein YciE
MNPLSNIQPHSLQLGTLQDLLMKQLKDLYELENQLLVSLPKFAGAASEEQLRSVFQDHLHETREHVRRLEVIFEQVGLSNRRGDSSGVIKALMAEGEAIMEASGDAAVRDAALITIAQCVEHFEMAAYGAARSIADQLGHHEIARILQVTLNEEGHADRELSKIAEIWVNMQAAHA